MVALRLVHQMVLWERAQHHGRETNFSSRWMDDTEGHVC